MDATTLNLILGILAPALTAIIAWVCAAARRKWGIQIEANHREALQSALLNGARLALRHELTGKAAVDLVLRYIKQSVPGAIRQLDATPEVLTDLAKAKLEQAANEKAKEVTASAVDALTDALRGAGLSAVDLNRLR